MDNRSEGLWFDQAHSDGSELSLKDWIALAIETLRKQASIDQPAESK